MVEIIFLSDLSLYNSSAIAELFVKNKSFDNKAGKVDLPLSLQGIKVTSGTYIADLSISGTRIYQQIAVK